MQLFQRYILAVVEYFKNTAHAWARTISFEIGILSCVFFVSVFHFCIAETCRSNKAIKTNFSWPANVYPYVHDFKRRSVTGAGIQFKFLDKRVGSRYHGSQLLLWGL